MHRTGTPQIGEPNRGGYVEIRFDLDTDLTPGWEACIEAAQNSNDATGFPLNRGGGMAWTIEGPRRIRVLSRQLPEQVQARMVRVDDVLEKARECYATQGRAIDERIAAEQRGEQQLRNAEQQRRALDEQRRQQLAQQFSV